MQAEQREHGLTQVEIAAHLDISDRRLRELLVELHLDHKRNSLSEIRVAYIRRLREEAAGRQGESDIADLPLERALLAREQREGQRIKNEVARGSYAPIDLLGDVLATASQAIVDRLDQIPGALRRNCPNLDAATRDTVMNEIASARNEWVRQTESLLVDLIAETDQPVDDEPALEVPADED
jgi:phage terminase Nu1 subunit (DNA packaging protein)